MNVVKVAAKQKEGKMSTMGLNPRLNLRQKQPQFSLNTTQALEDQLKLATNNKNTLLIPQKAKVQSKSRGQLNSSIGNIQQSKLPSKKRSPTP